MYEWFKEVYKNWSSEWYELFTSQELYFIPRPQYYFPLNQSWETQENLTLLGDAAHRMPPFAGKGANLALLDALELAENLTSTQFSNIQSALSDFEKRMIQRAAEAVKETLANAEQLFGADALDKLVSIFEKANTIS
jgi:2-polyprenyl-6-methoxyphenol hydroxylase-like FAD-dependent oxidoreductase